MSVRGKFLAWGVPILAASGAFLIIFFFFKDLLPYAILAAAFAVAVLLTVLIIRHRILFKREYGKLKFRCKSRVSGLVFGLRLRSVGRYLCCLPSVESHCLVVGSTGSGKSSSILIPSIRAWCKPPKNSASKSRISPPTAYVIDISGDIEKNVDIPNKAVIAPDSDLAALGAFSKYDVLHSVDRENDETERNEQLEQLSFALIPEMAKEETSKFYEQESRKLLLAALSAYYNAPSRLDFPDICRAILRQSAEQLVDDVMASGVEYAIYLASGFVGSNERTLTATKQEVDKAITLFAVNEKIANVIGRGGVAPCDLESRSVFLNISDHKLLIYNPLLRLITLQVLGYISAREVTKTSAEIAIFLDEFSSLGGGGRIEIKDTLRKARKHKTHVVMCVQSQSDIVLSQGGITEGKAFLDNIPYIICLNAIGESQEVFSRLAGEYTDYDTGRRIRNVPPECFGRLAARKRLILFHGAGAGYIELRNNFYYKKSFLELLHSVFKKRTRPTDRAQAARVSQSGEI